MDFDRGDHLGLSSITTTVHVGAHVDAPNHYRAGAESIDARKLEYYLGACQVIRVKAAPGARLRPEDCAHVRIEAPRVLIRTESFTDPEHWHTEFNSLSREFVAWLASQGVRLVGIDTPSIDPAKDQELESHQAVYRHGMAILEGIVLSGVPEGVYQLSALPLRLAGADASPVRAVLWK